MRDKYDGLALEEDLNLAVENTVSDLPGTADDLRVHEQLAGVVHREHLTAPLFGALADALLLLEALKGHHEHYPPRVEGGLW